MTLSFGMKISFSRIAVFTVLGLVVAVGLWSWRNAAADDAAGGPEREARPAPVAVARVERGSIELRRTISGTLEAHSEFVVAPKVSGQVRAVAVDIADTVSRGQIVAELDDAEFVQEVLRAKADLAVAEANLAEARSLREISQREIERFDTLRDRGFTSASQYETAESESLAREAQLKVAEAELRRAEASLEAARIRARYTRIAVDWPDGGESRLVADRFADPGDTVGTNEPILRIVELDTITAVIFVTERDYARLSPGQSARFETDAFPGEVFTGVVERIAPVFREATRQARVELAIDNADHRLKPGMFVRVRLTLDQADGVVIVPEPALTRRQNQTGVFVVVEDAELAVRWVPVTVGIQNAGRVEVSGEGVEGRVVVLGHQLIEDGSRIVIPANESRTVEAGS